MSDFTTCNYCNYQHMKVGAKIIGCRLVIRSSEHSMGGIDVYRLDKGERMPKIIDKKWHDAHFVAWFMELTNHCCC